MKILIVCGLLSLSSVAFSSDRLENEVICERTLPSGEVDPAFTIALQSNKTAWAKRILVTQNERLILSAQVPLRPLVRHDSRGFVSEDVLTYIAKEIQLEIHELAIAGRPLNGGVAVLNISPFVGQSIALKCRRQ